MRLALISYEYPPAVAVGGIGTYALEAVRMLTRGGVEVEVFTAGPDAMTTCKQTGAPVHRIDGHNRLDFSRQIAPLVVRRHSIKPFDVMESPEIGAEGADVARALPEIARVVKLHTPSYLVGQIGYEPPTPLEHLRFSLGGLRRGRIDFLHRPRYHAENDRECAFTRSADEIASPSRAIGAVIQRDWNLPGERISYFAYPFLPSPKLLAIPTASDTQTVGFLGRMEPRKGIIELTQAIPHILKKNPQLRFRFIGPSWPFKNSDMQTWIEGRLHRYRQSLTFVGSVSAQELPDALATCDILILPSRWESFGLVCAEGMAAGRAIIGSAAGGMAELIENGRTGLLVPPRNPQAIARAILSLAGNRELARRLAEAGRKSIVQKISPEAILPLQIASYERAMLRAHERNLSERQLHRF